MPITAPSCILDFPDPTGAPQRRRFTQPIKLLVAARLDQVRAVLDEVEQAAREGYYGVGYVSYEAAPAFDPHMIVREGARMPLAWFAIFDSVQSIPVSSRTAAHASHPLAWQPTVSRTDYDRRIDQIRSAIAAGETYQVNFTLRLHAAFDSDSAALYDALHGAQPTAFGAYLNLGNYHIVSLSPELFFERRNGTITTRPMKGTAPRGRWTAEDDQLATWLQHSPKNRAENLMIVDLLRNDLGRIATTGSVRVPELFTIERYPTVFQMTSTVAADERPGTTLTDLFAALFPCGSITGAPKISTMRLIAELEDTPREVYCGAIGMVEPGGAATFNVAIRTVVIDSDTGTATYGVGGGITWDSQPGDEYAEALSKAAILHESWPQFDLLETLRLKHGRYNLLNDHLQRLAASARYFNRSLDHAAVRAALLRERDMLIERDDTRRMYRVRLQVTADGNINIDAQVLPPPSTSPQPIAIATTPIDASNRFLFHKTTHRALYAAHRSEHPAAFDVLLWNTNGELTEFTIGNLVVRLDDQLWTPPQTSGLLAGVFRNMLLRRGTIAERVLHRDDLARASGIWLINSVRGWVRVRLIDECDEQTSTDHRVPPALKEAAIN